MTSDQSDRPENWPESFSLAGEDPSCPHQLVWDSAEGLYRCLYECGRTASEPPEGAIDAYEASRGDSRDADGTEEVS